MYVCMYIYIYIYIYMIPHGVREACAAAPTPDVPLQNKTTNKNTPKHETQIKHI